MFLFVVLGFMSPALGTDCAAGNCTEGEDASLLQRTVQRELQGDEEASMLQVNIGTHEQGSGSSSPGIGEEGACYTDWSGFADTNCEEGRGVWKVTCTPSEQVPAFLEMQSSSKKD